MEQLSQLVTSFENLMIAGGSLFALWGVYNLLEEKTKGRPGHGTEWWQVLAGVFIAGMWCLPHHLPAVQRHPRIMEIRERLLALAGRLPHRWCYVARANRSV